MSPDSTDLAALRFPHPAPPPPGTVKAVAPGVKWLRMPLPFALNHINLWLVEDGPGWAIVDSGVNNPATTALWDRILAEGLDGKPATRLIVTHYHPDHMGLAGWLTERLGIELWVTETEWRLAYERSRSEEAFHGIVAELYRRVGVADAEARIGHARRRSYKRLVSPVPLHHHTLSDGMELAIGGHRWRVIIGRGHAPEHACLYCPALDVLIAGDQVLPKISPNVSFWPADLDPDPLGSFLHSLDKLRRNVAPTSLVLPSHNLPFLGLHRRIAELEALHAERLDEIERACAQPRTTAEIVPILFQRALDDHQLGFAVGEALAHLQHATELGRLERYEREDGVWLYQARRR